MSQEIIKVQCEIVHEDIRFIFGSLIDQISNRHDRKMKKVRERLALDLGNASNEKLAEYITEIINVSTQQAEELNSLSQLLNSLNEADKRFGNPFAEEKPKDLTPETEVLEDSLDLKKYSL
jgi:uncharacterized protein Yka (UPF0111/DUF47 family)